MTRPYAGRVSQMEIPYVVRDGTAYWGQKPIESVDVATFHGLSNVWAVDKSKVFTEWRPRRIHRDSFEFLNNVFVKDKDHVYDYHGVVDGADPRTFECLDSGFVMGKGGVTYSIRARCYARDAKSVYYHDQMTGKASVVRGADPRTFMSLGNRFGKDATSVYFEKLKLPGAIAAKWFCFGHSYSTDQERVYYFNRLVPGVAVDTFRVMAFPSAGNYATDGKVFLRNDEPIAEAEFAAALFKAIESLPTYLQAFRQGFPVRNSASTPLESEKGG